MAPMHNLNHVTHVHPFMTCVVKVDTRYNWQKTISALLKKCHGVYNFRMNDHGEVEISGTIDPCVLLEKLGRAGRKAELKWFQFGECSNNLFMNRYNQDGRYLHSGNIGRPTLPLHKNIIRPSPHNHIHNYHHSYDQSHGCYHDHGYDHHRHDSDRCYDNYGYKQDEVEIHYHMACCIIM
ncbi:hypothetical protein ACS0TY_036342 [Phlomoides rotata]